MKIDFKFTNQYEYTLNPDSKVSDRIVSRAINAMEQFWSDNSGKIQFALREITGLSFDNKTIPCYLNSKTSLSDPLSIKIEKVGDMQDNLVHELIHILLTQNYEKVVFKKKWDFFWESFKDEVPSCRSHIMVHAIHFLVLSRIKPSRLKRIVEYSKHKSYVRSWKIVRTIGARNIVDRYLVD